MVILKYPVNKKIECICGCIFVFNNDDLTHESVDSIEDGRMTHVKVYCPFCGKEHILKSVKY